MKLEHKIDNLLGKRYDFITIDDPIDMHAIDMLHDLQQGICRKYNYEQPKEALSEEEMQKLTEEEEKEREEYLKRLEKEREYDFKIRLGRSQFNYKGEDKLYPTNSKFIPNPTWTSNLVSKHLASQKEQYSAPRKRQQSKKSLKGSRGNSDNSNSSSYLYSSSSSSGSSSSSWSSSGWGGGGFDGGGSSGSW